MAILSPTPTEKKEHQEEQRTREPKAEADVGGGGEAPCAVYSEGHGEQKLLFARKGKWDSEEMGGKQKVKGGGVVMHKKRGWRAVHFSPTP